MLNSRQLDLAVLFQADSGRRWSVLPLLDERLFVIAAPHLPGRPTTAKVRLKQLGALPLLLNTGTHGLRATLDAAFARARVVPNIVAEIDSLAMLMDAARAALGATIQPGAATARLSDDELAVCEVADADATRHNLLASLSDDELSPAALAARVVIAEVAREVVAVGRWPGAALSPHTRAR